VQAFRVVDKHSRYIGIYRILNLAYISNDRLNAMLLQTDTGTHPHAARNQYFAIGYRSDHGVMVMLVRMSRFWFVLSAHREDLRIGSDKILAGGYLASLDGENFIKLGAAKVRGNGLMVICNDCKFHLLPSIRV
jgi:hypothetical protein